MTKKPNRSETELVKTAKDVLEIYERSGKIALYMRVNSGGVRTMTGHYYHGARKGTADLMVVTANGITVWLEAKKAESEKLRDCQKEFKAAIALIPHHFYKRFNTVPEMIEALEEVGVKI